MYVDWGEGPEYCKHWVMAAELQCDWGLPWWPRGKEPTRQGRGHGSDSWSRKIPRALEATKSEHHN